MLAHRRDRRGDRSFAKDRQLATAQSLKLRLWRNTMRWRWRWLLNQLVRCSGLWFSTNSRQPSRTITVSTLLENITLAPLLRASFSAYPTGSTLRCAWTRSMRSGR